jgi:hypothetical protein
MEDSLYGHNHYPVLFPSSEDGLMAESAELQITD